MSPALKRPMKKIIITRGKRVQSALNIEEQKRTQSTHKSSRILSLRINAQTYKTKYLSSRPNRTPVAASASPSPKKTPQKSVIQTKTSKRSHFFPARCAYSSEGESPMS